MPNVFLLWLMGIALCEPWKLFPLFLYPASGSFLTCISVLSKKTQERSSADHRPLSLCSSLMCGTGAFSPSLPWPTQVLSYTSSIHRDFWAPPGLSPCITAWKFLQPVSKGSCWAHINSFFSLGLLSCITWCHMSENDRLIYFVHFLSFRWSGRGVGPYYSILVGSRSAKVSFF